MNRAEAERRLSEARREASIAYADRERVPKSDAYRMTFRECCQRVRWCLALLEEFTA